MRFLLDENAEYRIAAFLVALGHDVTTIAHDYPAGLDDEAVLAIAQEEARVLITNDRDFGELIIQRQLAHSGVILLRLRSQSVQAKITRLMAVLASHNAQLDQFIVVTDRRIRIRPQ
jgi:predicted nuclease of predicted toxin-antitoxin system